MRTFHNPSHILVYMIFFINYNPYVVKTIIVSSKRTYWFKVPVAFLTCLLFLIFPSCQKDELNQDSILDMDAMSLPVSSSKDNLKNGRDYLYIACENSDYAVQYKMDGSGTIKKICSGFWGISSLAINPKTKELFLSDDDGTPGVYVVHSDQSIMGIGENGDNGNPNALAFDNHNGLLVADANGYILRYDLTQNQKTIIGVGFCIPQGIAFYNKNIYFSDCGGYIYFIESDDINLPVNKEDISHRLINTPLVEGSDGGLISDDKGKLYASDAHGKVVIVDVKNKTFEYINLGDGIRNRGLALIDNQRKLLVSDMDNGRILVVNLSDKSVSVFLENSLLIGPFGLLVSNRDFSYFQK
jgi:DNA-binding beta-propeller fold protein YncE